MNGFIDGYMNKKAGGPASQYAAFLRKLRMRNPTVYKQLQMVQSMYQDDPDAKSLMYLDKFRKKPQAQQEAGIRAQPQHLMRVLNTAKSSPAGQNPYKGKSFKGRAGWSMHGQKFLDDLSKNLSSKSLTSTYNLKKAPNAGK